ncbi:MAG: hypothetical protein R3E65_07295 [Steroidobacteraceae bacterium]
MVADHRQAGESAGRVLAHGFGMIAERFLEALQQNLALLVRGVDLRLVGVVND